MYSYAPSKLGDNLTVGFEILKLKNELLDLISNNLNAAPSLNIEHANFYEVWQTIKELSQSVGLVEGFNFKFTKKK